MAAVAAQEPTGGVADLLNGPRLSVPLHSRVLHDEPFQRSQPLYVPNAQPFMPYQWPLPAPYVPYGGFPGLGYGMMMPPLLLPPCLEVPGYLLPPAQLLDYRRMMSSHMAPNVAHQAYRFRFQHAAPRGRPMVSSEVQTEPLRHSAAQDSCNRSHAGSESGRGTGCGSPVSASASFSENKSIACPEETSVMIQNRVVATNTINTTDVSAGHGSDIIVQAERVQIKCSETPSRFKIVCTNENTELASNHTGDLLQCSLGSIHPEDVVLCSYQSLAFRKDKQTVEAGSSRHFRKHRHPACHELHKIKMSPSCGAFKTYPNRSNVAKSFEANRSSEMRVQRVSRLVTGKHDENSSHNVDCKILRLPFDMQNIHLTRQLEASIWSVESLVPYVPSSDWLLKNGLITPQKSPVSDGKNLHVVSSKPHKSRSPYRPSTSWLADFGNVYYYSKLPVLQQKISSVCNSPEKRPHKIPLVSLATEGKQPVSPEFSPPGHEKKRRNQEHAVRTEISDQKHRAIHSCKCTAKNSSRPRVRAGWASHFSLVEKLPHSSCKNNCRGRDHARLSLSDSLFCKREDSVEVKISDGKRATEPSVRAHGTQKVLSGGPLGKYHQVKLGDEADLCEDCRCCHHPSAGQKRCAERGLSVWQQNEEDGVLSESWRWSDAQQRPQRGSAQDWEKLSTGAQRAHTVKTAH